MILQDKIEKYEDEKRQGSSLESLIRRWFLRVPVLVVAETIGVACVHPVWAWTNEGIQG